MNIAVVSITILSFITFSHPTNDQIPLQKDKKRLLVTSANETLWADPEKLASEGVKFVDKTDHLDMELEAPFTRNRLSKYQYHLLGDDKKVFQMFQNIDTLRIKERLKVFTGFTNRYYRSKTGVQSQTWLKTTILSIIESTGVNATLKEFTHKWDQSSIIVRFSGKKSYRASSPFIIVGAHQDTVKGGFFSEGRAPGADDDGSGSITTLEAFTVLCENNFSPVLPVEFHWYSAEEMGLLGSQDIAHKYQEQKLDVVAMIQFDMPGYNKNGVIGIVEDYVDEKLTEILKVLVEKYCNINYVRTLCKYGCSDHASWHDAGFRSAFPFEGAFSDSSPYIHGKDDTVSHIDFGHMSEFVKLAIAYVMELNVSRI